MRRGIGDRQLRELRELLAAEQHDESVLADQHAGSGLVAEQRVVAEPELREERLAALEVGYRDAHEQHAPGVCGSGQGRSPVWWFDAVRLDRRADPAELIG